MDLALFLLISIFCCLMCQCSASIANRLKVSRCLVCKCQNTLPGLTYFSGLAWEHIRMLAFGSKSVRLFGCLLLSNAESANTHGEDIQSKSITRIQYTILLWIQRTGSLSEHHALFLVLKVVQAWAQKGSFSNFQSEGMHEKYSTFQVFKHAPLMFHSFLLTSVTFATVGPVGPVGRKQRWSLGGGAQPATNTNRPSL